MSINEITEGGLYYRSWTIENPKAAVQLIHGLGEHCARYNALAEALNQAGYSLYAMDLPNHGKSAGSPGHIDGFTVFQDAALGLYQRISQALPSTPIYLLGHSMGGLIVTRLLLEHQNKFKGALLSGPAIETPQEPPAWQVWIIKLIAMLFPKARILQLDASGISQDPAVVEKYMNDPLVNKGKLSARFLLWFNTTIRECKQRASEITLPLLVMHGTADVVTAPNGSEYLINNISSENKTLKLYDGLFHELFNEPEAPTVYRDVITWLEMTK